MDRKVSAKNTRYRFELSGIHQLRPRGLFIKRSLSAQREPAAVAERHSACIAEGPVLGQ